MDVAGWVEASVLWHEAQVKVAAAAGHTTAKTINALARSILENPPRS
jgi:hypothetical protein